MQKHILTTILILFLSCSKSDQVKMFDKEKFIGKPVCEFINSFGLEYTDYQFVQEPPGKLIGCQFVFSKDLRIIVYVKELKHVKKFNIDGKWDIEKFKKETISDIEIIKSES